MSQTTGLEEGGRSINNLFDQIPVYSLLASPLSPQKQFRRSVSMKLENGGGEVAGRNA